MTALPILVGLASGNRDDGDPLESEEARSR